MRQLIQTLCCVAILLTSLADSLVAHEGQHRFLLGTIHPDISADGTRIVYSHQGAIWWIPAAGGTARRVTSGEGYDNQPVWSPDGQRIAFVNGRNSHTGPAQIVSADGRPTGHPPLPVAKGKLFFSADGRSLLGMFKADGSQFKLCWTEIATGRTGPQLQHDVRGLQYALSPDGQQIAFSRTKDVMPGEQGGVFGPTCDIRLVPSGSGSVRQLTTFPGRIYELSWADNNALHVVTNLGGSHNDIWKVPLSAPEKGTVKVTMGQADEDHPTVDAAGSQMVFTDNRHGPTAIVRRDLQTGQDTMVAATKRDFGAPAGRLFLETTDAITKERVTARVSLQRKGGKYHAPADAIYRMLTTGTRAMHFYCEGRAGIELPAGDYTATVSRGPEYEVQRYDFVVGAGANLNQNFQLKRWIHQEKRGWYSGESHIHANYGYGEWYNTPQSMLAQAAGEDLIVSNFMVANSDSDGVFDREFFRGKPDPLSTSDTILFWNQEFRSTLWGHMTLLNLRHLVEPIFTGFADTTHPHDHPTNTDIGRLTHDQEGHVNYTHPAQNLKDPYLSAYSAKALPIDVALGTVDSMDVMGSNHKANLEVWYRLLNCGFRLPAAAGTDCFLNRVRSRLPGQVRAYVRVDGQFSYSKWIEGLQAGRTFVTDGPMLDLRADGKMAGSTVKLDKPGTVSIEGLVRSRFALTSAEIVVNGKVVRTVRPGRNSREIALNGKVSVRQSGWIAVRAQGVPHPDQPTGNQICHSSPIYVEVRDRPLNSRPEAQYFLQWVDRLDEDLRRRNRVPIRHREHVDGQLQQARDVFRQLAN